MKSDTFQLIVIGAGIGGCSIASEAARQGLSVVLIDKRKKENLGENYFCNTIPSYIFDELGLPVPGDEEIKFIMKGLKVFSPDMHYYSADISVYLVDRQIFGQRLLGYALENGANYFPETEYREPVIENNYVTGVRCRIPGGKEREFRGQIICDASGYPGVVRNSLPDSIYHNEPLNPYDAARGYREIRDFITPSRQTGCHTGKVSSKDPSEKIPARDFPGCYCYIRSQGYIWIIPEKEGKGNIGCLVPLNPGNLDPVTLTKQFCDSLPEAIGGEIYDASFCGSPNDTTQHLPLRTCQPELAGNGFLVVGDAAYQASPVSAYDMGGAMIAGNLAAEVATTAIKNKDVSKNRLWEYNIRYKIGRGAAQGFLHPLRIFIQHSTDYELNILIKKGLLGATEFSLIWTNHTFTYTWTDRIIKFFKGFPHILLLLKFHFVYTLCKKMEKHYRQFPPDVEAFEKWNIKRRKMYLRLFRWLNIKRHI